MASVNQYREYALQVAKLADERAAKKAEIESIELRLDELMNSDGPPENASRLRDQIAKSVDKLRYLREELLEVTSKWRRAKVDAKCAELDLLQPR